MQRANSQSSIFKIVFPQMFLRLYPKLSRREGFGRTSMLLPGRLLLGAALLKSFLVGFFFFGRSGFTSPSENTSSGKSELT